ncbi:MAG: hypothetical protein AAF557_18750 [Pseudomonadota bacterium]
MSVSIPSSFDFGLDVDLDVSGQLNSNVGLNGNLDVKIPTSYNIDIPTNYSVSIREIAPIEIKPLDLSLRLKEIPCIRGHLPVNYAVGFSLLGRELACIRLCGQGQFITEPYEPYPCEPPKGSFEPQPNPVPVPTEPEPVG